MESRLDQSTSRDEVHSPCFETSAGRDRLTDIFQSQRQGLFYAALRLLGNVEDAEDAVQEGLLSALRNLHQLKGRSNLLTWLTRIVINAALIQLRRRRRGIVSMDATLNEEGQEWAIAFADPGLNPEEAFARQEQLLLLERGVQRLGTHYRAVLRLRDFQGLNGREAADALGLSEGTLKSQLSRARRKLRNGINAPPSAQASVGRTRRNVPRSRHLPISSSQFAERLARQPAA